MGLSYYNYVPNDKWLDSYVTIEYNTVHKMPKDNALQTLVSRDTVEKSLRLEKRIPIGSSRFSLITKIVFLSN